MFYRNAKAFFDCSSEEPPDACRTFSLSHGKHPLHTPCPSRAVCPCKALEESPPSTVGLPDRPPPIPVTNGGQSASSRRPQRNEFLSSIRRDFCRWIAAPFFRSTRSIGMHLDISAVQCKSLHPFYINGLRLELLFDAIENSPLRPIAKAAVNAIPVTEFFGQIAPTTTVFRNVWHCLKKS